MVAAEHYRTSACPKVPKKKLSKKERCCPAVVVTDLMHTTKPQLLARLSTACELPPPLFTIYICMHHLDHLYMYASPVYMYMYASPVYIYMYASPGAWHAAPQALCGLRSSFPVLVYTMLSRASVPDTTHPSQREDGQHDTHATWPPSPSPSHCRAVISLPGRAIQLPGCV